MRVAKVGGNSWLRLLNIFKFSNLVARFYSTSVEFDVSFCMHITLDYDKKVNRNGLYFHTTDKRWLLCLKVFTFKTIKTRRA